MTRPLDKYVWIFLGVGFVAMSLGLYGIAKREKMIGSTDTAYWTIFGNSVWYVYGTFIGESVTRHIDHGQQAWTIR